MVKLNRQANALENIIEKIDEKIEVLKEKQETIEDKAFGDGRNMTGMEQEKWDTIEEHIVELETEKEDIENALDCLKNYCE